MRGKEARAVAFKVEGFGRDRHRVVGGGLVPGRICSCPQTRTESMASLQREWMPSSSTAAKVHSLRCNKYPPGTKPIHASGKKKQHKHKLFGPDFLRTFLTLAPECPWVKKFLPITGAAEKRTFWCGRPQFSAGTSMTRRGSRKTLYRKSLR